MRFIGETLRRFYYLIHKRRLDRELREEMDFHCSMMNDSQGNAFGNDLHLREQAAEVWGWGWLERLKQDVTFASRLFRRSPGLVLTAALVLGLGMGVNLTAFSFFNSLVLKPLPVRDPESLLRITRESPHASSTSIPFAEVKFYEQHANVFSVVLAQTGSRVSIEQGKQARAEFVTSNYFSDLGARSAYGRTLLASDGAADAPLVAVLGFGFWRSHFAGDLSLIGKTIHINEQPVTVEGIAAYDFMGLEGDSIDVWLPLEHHPDVVKGSTMLTDFSNGGVEMFARVKPGISKSAAANALIPLAAELSRLHPKETWKDERFVIRPGAQLGQLTMNELPFVALATVMTLLVLIIACANLGNLLLAHAVGREREIAMRIALGATRGRIVRQLLTESGLLSVLGCIVGFVLSVVASKALFLSVGLPLAVDLLPDWRTLLFAVVIAVLASVAFGLAPALKIVRQEHRRSRARLFFLGSQVVASCVLLVMTGLLVRALQRAAVTDFGFDYAKVISVDPSLYSHGLSGEAALTYINNLRADLSQVPGVERVGIATRLPMGNRITVGTLNQPRHMRVFMNSVSNDFFPALKIPLVSGRLFLPSDKQAILVGESCARQLWPAGDAIGKTFPGTHSTVVGVVGTARAMALRDGTSVEVYYPLEQKDYSEAVLLVRTANDPSATLQTIRERSRAVDQNVLPEVGLLQDAFASKLNDSVRMTKIVAVMGMIALLLAVVGLYGSVSHTVSQREHEFGVRIALGAGRAHVANTVVNSFRRLFVISLACGLLMAGGVSQMLRSELYGLSNLDPATYVSVIALLLAVAALAAIQPTLRAMRVDPANALRCE